MSNIIKNFEQSVKIQKDIVEKNITDWTVKAIPYYDDITVSVIGENWQEQIIKGSIKGLTIIDETLNYLL